jgi:hypothetical protein
MKKIVIGFVIFTALLLISAIALPFIFKDKIIAEIKNQINNQINAKVEFGDFNLSIIKSFPDFTFEISNVNVIGVDTFQLDTLTRIGKFSFNLDLMSVIKSENFKINAIEIADAYVHVKVLENGKANYDIAKTDTTAVVEQDTAQPTKFNLKLTEYTLKNFNLIYDDLSLKTFTSIKNLNHKGKGDFSQDLFLLTTLTDIEQLNVVYEGVKYFNKAKIDLKIDLDMDMPAMKFTFKENEFKINELILGLNGYVAMPAEDIDMQLSFFAKKTDFKNILSLVPVVYMTDFQQVKTSGKLALEGNVKGIYNEKSMPAFNLKLLVDKGYFQYPDLPKAISNINIQLAVDNKTGIPDQTLVDLSNFSFEMAGNPFLMKMQLKTPVSDPDIKASAKGNIDFGSLKDILPANSGMTFHGKLNADIEAAGRMSALNNKKYDQFALKGNLQLQDFQYQDSTYVAQISNLALNFTPQMVELTDLQAKTKKSDFKVNGKIDNLLQYYFNNQTLVGTFNLQSGLIDLNEFITSSTSDAATNNADTTSTPMTVIEIPSNYDFDIKASVGKLIYDNLEITNVNGLLMIKDQKVDLNNLSMNLLDGKMIMSGFYETKNKNAPSINFNLNIQDFDIQKTGTYLNSVEKMAPIVKSSFGKFDTKFTMIGTLDKAMMPVYESLTGGGNLKTKNVEVKDFPPMVKIAETLKQDQYKKLYVGNSDISFKFLNGRVYVEPFELKVKNTKAKISGSNGFDQTIDYVWALSIPRSEFGGAANQAAEGLMAALGGKTGLNINLPEIINVDAKVTGTVKAPKVSLTKVGSSEGTSGASATDLAKQKLQEELDKKKAELEAKAKEEAEKLKQQAETEALKQKAELEAKAKAEAERLKKEAEEKAKSELEKKKKEAEEKLKGLFKK